jgi:aldehyde dehydrogenase (NAD+)
MESDNYNDLVQASKEAHRKWRLVPAPQRGDIIRQFGNELRNEKNELAKKNSSLTQLPSRLNRVK